MIFCVLCGDSDGKHIYKAVEASMQAMLSKVGMDIAQSQNQITHICESCDHEVNDCYQIALKKEAEEEMLRMQLEKQNLEKIINQLQLNVVAAVEDSGVSAKDSLIATNNYNLGEQFPRLFDYENEDEEDDDEEFITYIKDETTTTTAEYKNGWQNINILESDNQEKCIEILDLESRTDIVENELDVVEEIQPLLCEDNVDINGVEFLQSNSTALSNTTENQLSINDFPLEIISDNKSPAETQQARKPGCPKRIKFKRRNAKVYSLPSTSVRSTEQTIATENLQPPPDQENVNDKFEAQYLNNNTQTLTTTTTENQIAISTSNENMLNKTSSAESLQKIKRKRRRRPNRFTIKKRKTKADSVVQTSKRSLVSLAATPKQKITMVDLQQSPGEENVNDKFEPQCLNNNTQTLTTTTTENQIAISTSKEDILKETTSAGSLQKIKRKRRRHPNRFTIKKRKTKADSVVQTSNTSPATPKQTIITDNIQPPPGQENVNDKFKQERLKNINTQTLTTTTENKLEIRTMENILDNKSTNESQQKRKSGRPTRIKVRRNTKVYCRDKISSSLPSSSVAKSKQNITSEVLPPLCGKENVDDKIEAEFLKNNTQTLTVPTANYLSIDTTKQDLLNKTSPAGSQQKIKRKRRRRPTRFKLVKRKGKVESVKKILNQSPAATIKTSKQQQIVEEMQTNYVQDNIKATIEAECFESNVQKLPATTQNNTSINLDKASPANIVRDISKQKRKRRRPKRLTRLKKSAKVNYHKKISKKSQLLFSKSKENSAKAVRNIQEIIDSKNTSAIVNKKLLIGQTDDKLPATELHDEKFSIPTCSKHVTTDISMVTKNQIQTPAKNAQLNNGGPKEKTKPSIIDKNNTKNKSISKPNTSYIQFLKVIEGDYMCKLCTQSEKRYTRLGVAYRHLREIHLERKIYVCKICGCKTTNSSNSRRHFKERHANRKYSVEIISKPNQQKRTESNGSTYESLVKLAAKLTSLYKSDKSPISYAKFYRKVGCHYQCGLCKQLQKYSFPSSVSAHVKKIHFGIK